MSIPIRHRANITKPSEPRIYFVTSKTAQGKCVLQSAPMADLLIDVLRQSTAAGKFTVHEFVVMRNHFHVLMKVPAGMTVERAVQLIKGTSPIARRRNSVSMEKFGRRAFPTFASPTKKRSRATSSTSRRTQSKQDTHLPPTSIPTAPRTSGGRKKEQNPHQQAGSEAPAQPGG